VVPAALVVLELADPVAAHPELALADRAAVAADVALPSQALLTSFTGN